MQWVVSISQLTLLCGNGRDEEMSWVPRHFITDQLFLQHLSIILHNGPASRKFPEPSFKEMSCISKRLFSRVSTGFRFEERKRNRLVGIRDGERKE